MGDDPNDWSDFHAGCIKAANKAETRASNLAAFGILSTVLGLLSTVAYVAAAFGAETEEDRDDILGLAPVAIGGLASFVLIAVVLFAAASLVDIAGKRLRLDLMAATDRQSSE